MNMKRVLKFYLVTPKRLIKIKKINFTLGLVIGILLSLLISPRFDDCSSFSLFTKSPEFSFSQSSFKQLLIWFQTIIKSDFNPVVRLKFNSSLQSSVSLNGQQQIKRPRFFTDELDFKEDLLIAVLTNGPSLSNLGKAINSTLAIFADKLLFFTTSESNSHSNLIHLPSSDTDSNQADSKKEVLFKMLNYLSTHKDAESNRNYIKTYRFIFFVSDDIYIQGNRLTKLLSSYSLSDILLILGSPQDSLTNGSCSNLNINLKLGVFINENLWLQCKLDLNCWSDHCQDNVYSTYNLKFDHSDKLIVNRDLFQSSLITYPLFTSIMYYNIHYLNLEISMQQVTSKIKELDQKMNSLNQYMEISSWPIAVNPPLKPTDRFEVNQWSFINGSHKFFPNDFDVILPMSYYDQNDLNQIKDICIRYIYNNLNFNFINSIEFLNIYRSFDATRGLEYIIDINIHLSPGVSKKRFQILKPLNPIEMITKLPYVNENSRLTLFLTITSDHQVENLTTFINQFIDICIKHPEAQNLLIIFLIQSPNDSNSNQYSNIKSLILSAQTKYKSTNFKILLQTVESGQKSKIPNEIGLIDLMSKKYSNIISKSIIMNCKSNCLLSLNFLNRVRMNTIKGHQVFFPIPFVEYQLRQRDGQRLSNNFDFDINKPNGRFDMNDYRFYSFHFDDYWKARVIIVNQLPIANHVKDLKEDVWYDSNWDLMQLFLNHNCQNQQSKLNIFRAIEPELKLKYFKIDCHQHESNLISFQNCNQSNLYSIGSAFHLSRIISEYKRSKNHQNNHT